MRVVVADDSVLLREGLVRLLTEVDCEVVAAVEDAPALIEAVRVHASQRGSGLGTEMIGWAVAEARRQGCAVVQLTSDATRVDAHRFYERIGFEASHLGFKMTLGD